MKLPTTIQQLLKLRGSNPPPPPPIQRLSGILTSSILDAKEKNAVTAWLVLTVCRRERSPVSSSWTVSHQECYTDLHSVDRQPSDIRRTPLPFCHQERSGQFLNQVRPPEGGQHRSADARERVQEHNFRWSAQGKCRSQVGRIGVCDFIVSFWGSRVFLLFFGSHPGYPQFGRAHKRIGR